MPDLHLLEWIVRECVAGWERGEGLLVEGYLEAHPELADGKCLLELVLNELTVRAERVADRRLLQREYLRRFPALAEPIREQFEFLDVLDGLPVLADLSAPCLQAGQEAGNGTVFRDAPPDVSGYLLLEEIAQGGTGIVYRADDLALSRRVAVKILRADRCQLAGRFQREALVTAQLQHPGVPPVHASGVLNDGRPFLALKLVEGQTLAQLLKSRKDPAANLPHFLEIFVQVCRTVAYAHSRGVIHRDLKPSNVMVGSFGEVQVMDWGFAKALGQTDSNDASGDTAKHGGENETLGGTLLGTLSYMAPEQACGDVSRHDRRTDVFGLGAILCEVLTGQPPYVGKDSDEVLHKASHADLADAYARLNCCGADAGLAELARRCLTLQSGSRPAHAGELMAALEAHQTEEREGQLRREKDRVSRLAWEEKDEADRRTRREAEARAEADRRVRSAEEARAKAEGRGRAAGRRNLAVALMVTLPAVVGLLIELETRPAAIRTAEARGKALERADVRAEALARAEAEAGAQAKTPAPPEEWHREARARVNELERAGLLVLSARERKDKATLRVNRHSEGRDSETSSQSIIENQAWLAFLKALEGVREIRAFK